MLFLPLLVSANEPENPKNKCEKKNHILSSTNHFLHRFGKPFCYPAQASATCQSTGSDFDSWRLKKVVGMEHQFVEEEHDLAYSKVKKSTVL